jgi:hypothetical protein
MRLTALNKCRFFLFICRVLLAFAVQKLALPSGPMMDKNGVAVRVHPALVKERPFLGYMETRGLSVSAISSMDTPRGSPVPFAFFAPQSHTVTNTS